MINQATLHAVANLHGAHSLFSEPAISIRDQEVVTSIRRPARCVDVRVTCELCWFSCTPPDASIILWR